MPIFRVFWMNVMKSYVDVQTSLNIVLRHATHFKLLSFLSHTITYTLIFWRHPTSLNASQLFLVTLLLFSLANHSCYRLNSLLRILYKITCFTLTKIRVGLLMHRWILLKIFSVGIIVS